MAVRPRPPHFPVWLPANGTTVARRRRQQHARRYLPAQAELLQADLPPSVPIGRAARSVHRRQIQRAVAAAGADVHHERVSHHSALWSAKTAAMSEVEGRCLVQDDAGRHQALQRDCVRVCHLRISRKSAWRSGGRQDEGRDSELGRRAVLGRAAEQRRHIHPDLGAGILRLL